MEFELLETERLFLRKLTPEVYDYIYSNYTDEECMLHLGLSSHEELEKEKERYEKGLSAYDRTFVIFQLVIKESQEIIGMTGFVRFYPDHSRAELGYAMSKEEHKNKGYMFEATERIVQYGFESMNLNRMEALSGSNNIPSLKIIDKLGFKKEGHLKEHYCRGGIVEDSLIFALLKSEKRASN